MGIVRALFATSPGLGHVFPTISLAHALRAAGHEVLVATAGGKEAANAGLHVVDTAPGVDIGAVFQQAASEQPEEFDYSTDVDTEKGLEFVGAIFAKLSGVSVDLTVSAGESWRPDVVVYSSMEGTGRLADAVRAVQRRRRAARVGARTAGAPARRGDTRHGADPGRRAHVVDQTRRRGTASGRRVRTRPRRRGPVATGRTAGQRAGGRVGAAVRAAADLRGAGAPRRGRLDADRDRRRSHAARAAARRRPVHERGRRGAARARSAFGAGSGGRGADRPPAHRPGAGPGRLRGGRRERDAAEARRPRAENRRPRLTLPGVHTSRKPRSQTANGFLVICYSAARLA